jgi:hypothetical protein
MRPDLLVRRPAECNQNRRGWEWFEHGGQRLVPSLTGRGCLVSCKHDHSLHLSELQGGAGSRVCRTGWIPRSPILRPVSDLWRSGARFG